MALLTISGDPASRWEEVARGAAQTLGYELVTETRLAQWMTEEFGETPVPAKAWTPAAAAVLARLAREHPLLIAIDAPALVGQCPDRSSRRIGSTVRYAATAGSFVATSIVPLCWNTSATHVRSACAA